MNVAMTRLVVDCRAALHLAAEEIEVFARRIEGCVVETATIDALTKA